MLLIGNITVGRGSTCVRVWSEGDRKSWRKGGRWATMCPQKGNDAVDYSAKALESYKLLDELCFGPEVIATVLTAAEDREANVRRGRSRAEPPMPSVVGIGLGPQSEARDGREVLRLYLRLSNTFHGEIPDSRFGLRDGVRCLTPAT
jgi:hypothetical protein